MLRIPLTYEVFHFLTGETLVSAVKIYFTPQNLSKEKFKLLAGKKKTFTAKTTTCKGDLLNSAVKIYLTLQNPSKEKFKLLAGENPKTTTTFIAKTTKSKDDKR